MRKTLRPTRGTLLSLLLLALISGIAIPLAFGGGQTAMPSQTAPPAERPRALPAAAPSLDQRFAAPRYFHPGGTSADGTQPVLSVETATAQLKRVAAQRGATLDEIRRLVKAHIADGTPMVDLPSLNRALDQRWPMP